MVLPSSASRRETISENHSLKKIGCMSGIFHIFNRYNNHSRKRLTSAAKKLNGYNNSSAKSNPCSKKEVSEVIVKTCEAESKKEMSKNANPMDVLKESKETKRKVLPDITPSRITLKEIITTNKEQSPENTYSRSISDAIPRSPTLSSSIRKLENSVTPLLGFKKSKEMKRKKLPEKNSSDKIPKKISVSMTEESLEKTINQIKTPENSKRRLTLVARLMGMDEIPEATPPETASEKRRKLLSALERCDEDLKSLGKIIEAIQVAETVRVSTSPEKAIKETICRLPQADLYVGDSATKDKKIVDYSSSDQSSPVSVLDQISPATKHAKGLERRKLQEDLHCSFFRLTSLTAPTPIPGWMSKPIENCPRTVKTTDRRTPFPVSKIMEETVNEVCSERFYELKKEEGRIAIMLESGVFEELMEEILAELGFYRNYFIPFHHLRRRKLYF